MFMIRQKQYPSVAKKLWGNALGSPSYFAASWAGAQVAIIRQYIEQQQTPKQPTTRNTFGVRAIHPPPLAQRISAHPVKNNRHELTCFSSPIQYKP